MWDRHQCDTLQFCIIIRSKVVFGLHSCADGLYQSVEFNQSHTSSLSLSISSASDSKASKTAAPSIKYDTVPTISVSARTFFWCIIHAYMVRRTEWNRDELSSTTSRTPRWCDCCSSCRCVVKLRLPRLKSIIFMKVSLFSLGRMSNEEMWSFQRVSKKCSQTKHIKLISPDGRQ